jgi:hypothetical protein
LIYDQFYPAQLFSAIAGARQEAIKKATTLAIAEMDKLDNPA